MNLDYLCKWEIRYLYIVLAGYMRILGAPSVQSCCTVSIYASYHVFVYSRYRKSRLICVWLSDLYLSRHHPLLWGAPPAIQWLRMAALPKHGKSGPHCWGREVSTQFEKQFVTAVTALPLVGVSFGACKLLSSHLFKTIPRRFSGTESVCSG